MRTAFWLSARSRKAAAATIEACGIIATIHTSLQVGFNGLMHHTCVMKFTSAESTISISTPIYSALTLSFPVDSRFLPAFLGISKANSKSNRSRL
jgi:hypothetical protein